MELTRRGLVVAASCLAPTYEVSVPKPPMFWERFEQFRRDFDLAEIGIEPEEYHAAKVIGEVHEADARHIATASVQRVDVLVSWNFKHIVNLDRIRGYNSVNLRLGYPLLEIRSPREILRDEDQET